MTIQIRWADWIDWVKREYPGGIVEVTLHREDPDDLKSGPFTMRILQVLEGKP